MNKRAEAWKGIRYGLMNENWLIPDSAIECTCVSGGKYVIYDRVEVGIAPEFQENIMESNLFLVLGDWHRYPPYLRVVLGPSGKSYGVISGMWTPILRRDSEYPSSRPFRSPFSIPSIRNNSDEKQQV